MEDRTGAQAARVRRPLLELIAALLRGRRANVAPMVALLLVPLSGALGLAGEGSSWYMTQRSMQNAADSAAIAAATNASSADDTGSTPTPMYAREAYAVASKYGFVSGTNNVIVS